LRRFLIALAAAVALQGSALQAQTFDRAAVIEYRQQLMRTLQAQFEAMMLVVTVDAPPQNLHSHLSVALIAARQMPAGRGAVHRADHVARSTLSS
jgi:hypothetical protein